MLVLSMYYKNLATTDDVPALPEGVRVSYSVLRKIMHVNPNDHTL
jgi:hypothetical protein